MVEPIALTEGEGGSEGPGGQAIVHLPAASRLRGQAAPDRAVFLDRDGVLVEDVHYLRRPEDVRVLEGVPEALRALAPRYCLIVVTNQSGVARGLFDEAELLRIHGRLLEVLAEGGATLDALYACPHLDAGCDCRKPAPGMLLRAATEHGLALDQSFMIGDAPRDAEAGRRAGARPLTLGPQMSSLSEALRWIP